MRLTFRQRFDFGPDAELVGSDLLRPEAWDALRTSGGGAFALATTRQELDARAHGNQQLVARARAIADGVRELGGSSVASYGVGTAALEALLEGEGLEMSLTEYAPRTVERLRCLFPSRRVELHDLLADRSLGDVDVHLFHRIDTDLTDAEWRDVFRRFNDVPVILVVAGIVTPRVLARQLLLRTSGRGTSSGWIRTRASLRALWAGTHEADDFRCADLAGWILRP